MHSLLFDRVGVHLNDAPKPSKLRFSLSDHPLGQMITLHSPHGLCYQGFHSTPQQALLEYTKHLPWTLELSQEPIANTNQPLHLIGTEFQLLVWQNLCKLPNGQVMNYSQFAQLCQRPSAVRAIASAIARNPIALEIPCHRIVPKRGGFGQYRWGDAIKQQLHRMESHQS